MMVNQLKKLRQENNALDKQLSKKNQLIITDMVCYLRSSDLCDHDLEIMRKDLTGMAMEAQLRGENFSTVAGEDFKVLCDELMKSGRQKSFYEKTLEFLTILIYGLGVLYIIEIIFSATIIHLFKSGQFTMPITSGFLLSSLFTLIFAIGVYYYITIKSFELSKRYHKAKIIFIVGFTAAWTTILLTKIFMKTVLITINFLYPLVLLIIAFMMIKFLNDLHDNNLFKRRM